jgi:hydroxymethylpyrimidine pyrophosphatase-like HAD family hydrolase
MIDIIFSDIDGCLVPQHYDYLVPEDGDAESERYFDYYHRYAGPQVVLCTGRAWSNTRGIWQRTRNFPRQRVGWPDTPVLCEHGLDVLTDPAAGRRVSLIDEVPSLASLKSVVKPIQEAAELLDAALEPMRERLAHALGRPVAPITLLKKLYSLAVRIPLYEGTLEQVSLPLFFDLVREQIDSPLGQWIDDGRVVFLCSTTAVDILPPVSKGDGVRYVLERYGTSPDRAVYIGDSAADIAGMEAVRWAACPANAVPDVLNYVTSLNGCGYRSGLSFADAEVEILEMVNLFSRKPGRPFR